MDKLSQEVDVKLSFLKKDIEGLNEYHKLGEDNPEFGLDFSDLHVTLKKGDDTLFFSAKEGKNEGYWKLRAYNELLKQLLNNQ